MEKLKLIEHFIRQADMKKIFISFIIILCLSIFTSTKDVYSNEIPDGFVEVNNFIPSVRYEMRYYSENNFIGEKIDGYDAPKCYLTKEAANSLKKFQEELLTKQLSLKIFDCYRPQKAVDHFVRWAKNLDDVKMKSVFYPSVDKQNLFRDGYIAEKSGHSRGSAVDLTITDLKNNEKELDMGSPFDFFDPVSHTINDMISKTQQDNRFILKNGMEKYGFKGITTEWWHYTLKNEPFPDKYFDFTVK